MTHPGAYTGTPMMVDGGSGSVAAPSAPLSAESQALLQAINRSLGSRLDNLASTVRVIDNKVTEVGNRVDNHDRDIKELIRRTEALERGSAGSVSSGGDGGTGSISRGPLRPPGWTPPAKRNIIVVGGFPADTERDIIVRHLREFSGPHPREPDGWDGRGVEDCYAPEYSSFGRIRFASSEHMWRFLKHHKGRKFQYDGRNLFHSIDKTPAEQELSRKVARAQQQLVTFLVDTGKLQAEPTRDDIRKMVAADWDIGMIRFKGENGVSRIFETDRQTGMMKIGSSAQASGLEMRFAESLQYINYGE